VDQIPKAIKATDRTVGSLLKAKAEMENLEDICDVLGKKKSASRFSITDYSKSSNTLWIEILSSSLVVNFRGLPLDLSVFNKPTCMTLILP
jgi:hypothetical protein